MPARFAAQALDSIQADRTDHSGTRDEHGVVATSSRHLGPVALARRARPYDHLGQGFEPPLAAGPLFSRLFTFHLPGTPAERDLRDLADVTPERQGSPPYEHEPPLVRLQEHGIHHRRHLGHTTFAGKE